MRLILCKKEYRHIYAFLFAVVVATVGFYWIGILPGQQWVNTSSDAFSQEAAFSRLWMRHLADGAGMFYSNEVSLGQNTSFVYAMYGYSPLSILYVLPLDLYTVMLIGNLLRIGFAAAFFELFLRKGMKIDHTATIAGAACYALSSFHIFFQQSANFDEGVYLFPLVMWMLMEFIRTGKVAGLCICYALSFTANFYCGYIIGVGSFCALMIRLILRDGKGFIRNNITLLVRYILLVFSAVAISMLLLMPALAFYSSTMQGEFSGTFYSKDSLQQLVQGFFWGTPKWPMSWSCSLYAGIPVLILLGMYFTNYRISRLERGVMGLALCSLFPAYYVEPVYLLLHAFNPPTGFPMRFAYVYVFLAVVLAARQYDLAERQEAEEDLRKRLFMIGIFCMAAGLIFVLTHEQDVRRISVNLLLVLIWGGILLFLRDGGKRKKTAILSSIILTIELISNTATVATKGMLSDAYNYSEEQIQPLVEWIKDEQQDGQLYRARVSAANTPNIQSERGYNGIGVFSTAVYPALQKFLIYMGDNTNGYYYRMDGNTDFMEMLLGIRYRARVNVPDPPFGHEVYYREVNDRALPIGFMASKQLETVESMRENPFENQNRIASALLGEEIEVYRYAELAAIQGENMTAEQTEAGGVYFQRENEEVEGRLAFLIPRYDYEHAYFLLSNVTMDRTLTEYQLDYDAGRISLYSDRDRWTEGVRGEDYFNPGKGVMEMDREEDWFYMLLMSRQDTGTVTEFQHLYTYYQDEEALARVYNELSSSGWNVLETDPLHIHAKVKSCEARPVLFLSIPYDPGWHCIVDGNAYEIKAVLDGTFSAVELPAGDHDIYLEYTVQGLWGGRISFILGLLSLGVMAAKDHHRRKGDEQ